MLVLVHFDKDHSKLWTKYGITGPKEYTFLMFSAHCQRLSDEVGLFKTPTNVGMVCFSKSFLVIALKLYL